MMLHDQNMDNTPKVNDRSYIPETFRKRFSTREIKVIKKYDPFQDPPDLDMAVEHGKAKKVYQHLTDEKYRVANPKACPCCGLEIVIIVYDLIFLMKSKGGNLIPLTANLKEIYHLGSGFATYFLFIKYSAILLGLIFLISGVFNIFTNYFGEDCPSEQESVDRDSFCRQSFIVSFTLTNRRDDAKLMSIFLVLNLVSVVAVMVFFHFIRYQFRKAEIIVDNEMITPSDFAIELKGVDSGMTDKEIIEWLKSFGNLRNPVNIVKLNRTYKIKKYIQLTREKEALIKKKKKYSGEDNELILINSRIDEIEEYFDDFKRKKLEPTSIVYAVFEKASQAEFVQDKFQKGYIRKKFERLLSKFVTTFDRLAGKRVTIERAPEPTDIIWENLDFTLLEQYEKKIFVTIITILLIGTGFSCVILINWIQDKIRNQMAQTSMSRFLSLISSVFIFFWDMIAGITIKKLAYRSKNPTLTAYYTEVAGKLSIVQLINAGFTTLCAKIIIANDFDIALTFRENLKVINIYGQGGLIENMYFVFILYAILEPLLIIFDPFYLYKLWRQNRVRNKKLTIKMTQKQAHNFFEGPDIDIADKYATLIRTILLASFYAPVMPFALIYSVVGLILTYWADKYIVLRRIALPHSLNNNLTNAMVEYLEWMAFMFAMGNLVFIYPLQDSSNQDVFSYIPTSVLWATIGISLFHIYFPMGWLNKRLFKISKEKTDTLTYTEARFDFTTDYDIENPITRRQALSDFMFKVKGMIEMGSKHGQRFLTAKEGAFTKLTVEDIFNLLNPLENEEDQDFGFLEKYAQEVYDGNLIQKKKSTVRMKLDLINILSKFDNFRGRPTKKTFINQFISNVKDSVGIHNDTETDKTDSVDFNLRGRESFIKLTPDKGKPNFQSYLDDFEQNIESKIGNKVRPNSNLTAESSKITDEGFFLFAEKLKTDSSSPLVISKFPVADGLYVDEDEANNLQIRQEFAKRKFRIQDNKLVTDK